jgi:hypothetical protein
MAVVACAAVGVSGASPPNQPASFVGGPISVDVASVPLDPRDPSRTSVGQFAYAGGIALSSRQTGRLHGLSDLVVFGNGRVTAVGDEGVWFEARLILDEAGRLVGVTDPRLEPLAGEDGKPLSAKADADAEGIAMLPNGDRLVSFERRHRIWLYPAAGGAPRAVAAPGTEFPDNGGMEALAADPGAGPDAYVVGGEASGETWTCRVASPCVKGPVIDKPVEFGLVALHRLPGERTAAMLRAWDPLRGNRIALKILRGTTLVDQMDLARPMTVDNFEGLAAVPQADGRIRFYLLSDDNASPSQRTLLLAFDWQPR